ncbi:MAG: LCP family protein [Patescibacteria group bacterium]|nr:LCP family protein [Patescibacteria group bacterium]
MYDEDKLLSELEPGRPARRRFFGDNTPFKVYAILRKTIKVLIYSLVFAVGLFILFYVNSNLSHSDTFSWVNRIPIIGQIKTFAETSSIPLKGEDRGRINILFLGIGGEGHDGANLTDTIIVFSIDTKDKKVAMLSIPRDLSIPIDNVGWRKINNVNAYAEMSQPGSGGEATSQAVSNLLKTPIDYYVRVDFEGFKKIIDYFGGVEVNVDTAFDDYTYPAAGQEDNPVYVNRFEHLHFNAGPQLMDGTTALKYARSRHSLGPEGTDFARAKRQQKVIQALKDKALSVGTITNPKLMANIFGELSKNVSTNLKGVEMLKLWSLVKDVKQGDVINKVLSNSPNGLLQDTTGADGAYLLTPRAGNFSEVEYLFNHIFETAPESSKVKVQGENAKVEILNGTWINGLAGKMATDLEKYNFNITHIANCSRQNFERTVIYDLTFGAKKDSLEMLKKQTGANVSYTLPDWLKNDLQAEAASGTVSQPDLVLIIGQDADSSYNSVE